MSKAKVVLRFDVFPGEKFDLELICKSLGISKIEFLRRSMKSSADMYEALKACEDYLCDMVVSVDKATKLLSIVQDAMNMWEGK